MGFSPPSLSGPTWDLSAHFRDISDPKISEEIQGIKRLTLDLSRLTKLFSDGTRGALVPKEPESLRAIVESCIQVRDEAQTRLHDLSTFAACLSSVDASLEKAKKLLSDADALAADLNVALKPLNLWLILAEPALFESLLESPKIKDEEFTIRHMRKLRDQTLSLEQESMLEQLEIHGPKGISRLYDDLTGAIQVHVKGVRSGAQSESAHNDGADQTIGLAEAANWLMSPDEKLRRATFEGIDGAFRAQELSFSAIINQLTGWRQAVLRLRSFKKEQHFLVPPLHRAHINRETLDAMMDVVSAHRHLGQKALKLQARLLNKNALDPWDLMAPCPTDPGQQSMTIGFNEGVEILRSAFGMLSPEMRDFVTMMVEKKWIDASVGPKKLPGAYCTAFYGKREPRVYMTYSGSLSNLSTLAHELGHAMHFWLMKDLPLPQLSYPMTLAETASIFAEALCDEYLSLQYKSQPHNLKAMLWASASDVGAFLLNIPARFSMESQFNEMRRKSLLTPKELCRITDDAWNFWYGSSLTAPQSMFWATKLHFSMSDLSFYNFPYTFGYLFSLSVFARREEFGKQFFEKYTHLLRDTGRMTAEAVAQKHLGEDISKPRFWLNAMKIVEARVGQFSRLVEE